MRLERCFGGGLVWGDALEARGGRPGSKLKIRRMGPGPSPSLLFSIRHARRPTMAGGSMRLSPRVQRPAETSIPSVRRGGRPGLYNEARRGKGTDRFRKVPHPTRPYKPWASEGELCLYNSSPFWMAPAREENTGEEISSHVPVQCVTGTPLGRRQGDHYVTLRDRAGAPSTPSGCDSKVFPMPRGA